MNLSYKWLGSHFILESVPYWPMSVFIPSLPTASGMIWSVLSLGIFIIAIRTVIKFPRIRIVLMFVILLALSTNLFHGFKTGYIIPIQGGKKNHSGQYWLTAKTITNPWQFFCEYERNQSSFLSHSRTHPPGTTLLIYYLHRLLGNMSLISITIALASLLVSLCAFYWLLLHHLEREKAVFVTFLFGLLPAIQIYYLASVDALISSIMLSAFCCFLISDKKKSLIGACFFLIMASQLTFAFIFLFPVFCQLSPQKNTKKLIIVFSVVLIFYMSVYFATGFNYLGSFQIASHLENPEGFALFAAPLSYFATRLEGIFEILLFFTPIFCLFFFCGMGPLKMQAHELHKYMMAALITVAALFLSGAFRTGETARVCMYLYPFLLLPVAAYLNSIELTADLKIKIASLVFLQTWGMQMIGTYFW